MLKLKRSDAYKYTNMPLCGEAIIESKVYYRFVFSSIRPKNVTSFMN